MPRQCSGTIGACSFPCRLALTDKPAPRSPLLLACSPSYIKHDATRSQHPPSSVRSPRSSSPTRSCFDLFVQERLVVCLGSRRHAGSSPLPGQCRQPPLGLGVQAVRLRGPAPRLAALPQPRLRRRRRRRRAVPLLVPLQPQLRLLLAVAARHLLRLALAVLVGLPRRRLRRRRGRRRRRHGPPAPAGTPRAAVPGGGRPLRDLPRPPRRLRRRGRGAPPRERRAPRRQRRPHAPPRAAQRHRQAGRRRRHRRRGPPAPLRRPEGRFGSRQGARPREARRPAQEHLRPLQRVPQDEPGPHHAGRQQPQASRVEPDQAQLARVHGGRRRREERRAGGQGATRGRGHGAGGVQPGHVQDGAVQQVGGDGGMPVRRPVPVRARRRRAPPRHPPPALQDPGLPHGARRRGLPVRPPLPLPPLAHLRRTPPPPPPVAEARRFFSKSRGPEHGQPFLPPVGTVRFYFI